MGVGKNSSEMLEMDEHAVWRAEDDGDGDGIYIPPPTELLNKVEQLGQMVGIAHTPRAGPKVVA